MILSRYNRILLWGFSFQENMLEVDRGYLMTKIIYINYDGDEVSLDVQNGLSVMQGAVKNDVDGINADCGGAQVCGTCKVIVDDKWIDAVGVPDEEEEAILAFGNAPPNCRLSCQIKVCPELDGLVVYTPERQY